MAHRDAAGDQISAFVGVDATRQEAPMARWAARTPTYPARATTSAGTAMTG